MAKKDPVREAAGLYTQYVAGTGFTPPATYAEMLLFAEMSGAFVCQVQSRVDDFWGIQIAEAVFVSGSSRLTDHERMMVLAHEWCHYLRRTTAQGKVARFYSSEGAERCDHNSTREWEERVARAFARLF